MQRLTLKSRQWIEDSHGNMIMGEGRRKILELIEKTGSINKAAKEMGMSYRGVWGKIKATERHLNQKILTAGKGQGSVLTKEGKKILNYYSRLKEGCRKADNEIFQEILLQE